MSKQFLGELKWVGEAPRAYIDYGPRSSLQPVQTPKGPVAPKPAQSKAYRVVVFLNRRIVLLDAMVSGGTPQQVASKVWHGQPLPAMPSVGSPSGTAAGLAQMQKWTVGMKILDKGKVVALYQCGLAGEPCSTPGSILKDYEISGAEGLGQAEQRLVDFLESDSKLSGRPAEFLGEVHWLGATLCDDLNNAVQALYMKKGSLQKNLDDLNVAVPKAKNAWDACYGNKVSQSCAGLTGDPLQACLEATIAFCNAQTQYEHLKQQQDSVKADLQSLQGQIVEAEAKYAKSCPSGGGGGGGPECSATKPCPPGKECWEGKCVDKCPSGSTRASDGSCKPVATPSKSSGLGLLVLGAAGVGLAFMASKSQLERIPQHPSRRLQENKHGRRRRY